MERLSIVWYPGDFCETIGELMEDDRFLLLGEVSNIAEILVQKPDLILMEAREGERSQELIECIRAEHPSGMIILVGSLEPDSILEVLRVGVREVVAPQQLVDAIERTWFHFQACFQTRTAQHQLVVVHSPKGGAGTSTLALNLAACLHKKHGQEVGLVDLCLQSGTIDLLLNLQPRTTWSDLYQLCGGQKLLGEEELEQTLSPSIHGLRLLAAPFRSEDSEVIELDIVEQALNEMRRKFAYTVVDTPSVFNELTLRSLELADLIMMAIPLTLPALRQAKRSLELWERLGIPSSKVAVVVWGQGQGITCSDARKILKHSVLQRLPWDPKGIEAAMNLGESLYLQVPRCAYSLGIRKLCSHLFKNQEQVKQTENWRIWKRIWRFNDVSKQQAKPQLI